MKDFLPEDGASTFAACALAHGEMGMNILRLLFAIGAATFATVGCAGGQVVSEAPGTPSSTSYPHNLERIESPVFETNGDRATIARRAIICAAQTLRPGMTNASTIIASDADAGVVVARDDIGLGSDEARSTVTIETKDGRFKITHMTIEMHLASVGSFVSPGWTKVAGPSLHCCNTDKIVGALNGVTQSLVGCIEKAPGATGEAW